jgi:hypothetical protein
MREQRAQVRSDRPFRGPGLIVAIAAAVTGVVLWIVLKPRAPAVNAKHEPIDDIAPPPPKVPVTPEEAPWRRAAAAEAHAAADAGRPDDLPPQKTFILPKAMHDVARPPHWTRQLAAPRPPEPPDPASPPPMAVNPEGH